MLLGTLGANLLGNLLTDKGAFHAGKGIHGQEKVKEYIELVKEL